MNTQEIAERLVALCREVRYKQAQDELFADDAWSREPEGAPWDTVQGREAMAAKVAKWESMVVEIHEADVSDPIVAGNFFSVKMTFDLTMTGVGRTQGREIVVYEVRDGKIVLEHFFYSV